MIRAATTEEIKHYAKLMGYHPSGGAKGVALLAEESVSALCIYDHWTPNAVQVHVYATELKSLFDEVYLREIFTYPFVTAARNVLVAVTPANHVGSLAVSDWMGFREVYRIKDGWEREVDMIIKELRKEDCRFILHESS